MPFEDIAKCHMWQIQLQHMVPCMRASILSILAVTVALLKWALISVVYNTYEHSC